MNNSFLHLCALCKNVIIKIHESELCEEVMEMNLAVIKSVFPYFDIENFNMFDEIISLKWETIYDYEFGEEHRNLIFKMTSPDHYQIVIAFQNVISFRFQGNGQILGFYIKDMSVRGYAKSEKYEVGDYEENAFKFYCSDVIIMNLEKITFQKREMN